MARWQDRLSEASYESPSGAKIFFAYEDVSKLVSTHTSAYDFPNADGTFIQDLGRSGRRIPLRIFFSGDDNDLLADKFDGMLAERGAGTLRHPRYGKIRVVPFGDIARQDPLVNNTNQTLFIVTFWETNELLFPSAEDSPGDIAAAAVAALLLVNPAAFNSVIKIPTINEESALLTAIKSGADRAKRGLAPITATIAAAKRRVDAVSKAINTAISNGVGNPLTLASQVGILITTPARTVALVADRLNAYSSLLVTIVTLDNIRSPGNDSQSANNFRNDDMQAAAMFAGMAIVVLDADFETQTEALSAAEDLLGVFDEWSTWRELNLVSLGEIDTGDQYNAVKNAVMRTAGFLVDTSFGLKQQRAITTVRARTPLDLESELYGTVDVNLDFLIDTNHFVGGDILEVPRGRRVVYFV